MSGYLGRRLGRYCVDESCASHWKAELATDVDAISARSVTLTQMTRSRDGVEIAYETYGTGGGAERPTVILVHGWAGNRTTWAHQVDYLAERHQVIAVDLGGHGESGFGRADRTLPAFGDDVVAVVDEVGAQKVALVGHSMGGDAVVHATRRLGDRVAGLVSSPNENQTFTDHAARRTRPRIRGW